MSAPKHNRHITNKQRANAKLLRTNSVIYAPFILNVVLKLLCAPLKQMNKHIKKWGGGLCQLQKCLPNWDLLVNEACDLTPSNYYIWRKFADDYKSDLSESHQNSTVNHKSDKDILNDLLCQWCKAGHDNHTFGSYPSSDQQEQYQEQCIFPIGKLNVAIFSGLLEDSFLANNNSLHNFIDKQMIVFDDYFVSYTVFDDVKLCQRAAVLAMIYLVMNFKPDADLLKRIHNNIEQKLYTFPFEWVTLQQASSDFKSILSTLTSIIRKCTQNCPVLFILS